MALSEINLNIAWHRMVLTHLINFGKHFRTLLFKLDRLTIFFNFRL